jgi:hypothetical protein
LPRMTIRENWASNRYRIGFGKELDMNRKEIEQAITELSPTELSRFRRWFETYYLQVVKDQTKRKRHIDELKGSLKGKGLMKVLIADKNFEKKF